MARAMPLPMPMWKPVWMLLLGMLLLGMLLGVLLPRCPPPQGGENASLVAPATPPETEPSHVACRMTSPARDRRPTTGRPTAITVPELPPRTRQTPTDARRPTTDVFAWPVAAPPRGRHAHGHGQRHRHLATATANRRRAPSSQRPVSGTRRERRGRRRVARHPCHLVPAISASWSCQVGGGLALCRCAAVRWGCKRCSEPRGVRCGAMWMCTAEGWALRTGRGRPLPSGSEQLGWSGPARLSVWAAGWLTPEPCMAWHRVLPTHTTEPLSFKASGAVLGPELLCAHLAC